MENKIVLHKDNFIVNKELKEFEIQLENVYFNYYNSESPIFEGINFKINKYDHTILTGPNGSGKTLYLA